MTPLRRLGIAFWLALALLFGQQAAALHDLGHAVNQIEHKGSVPAGSTCDQCFACAQLSGAVAATPPAVPAGTAHDAAPDGPASTPACAAPRFAFLSRGPPALL